MLWLTEIPDVLPARVVGLTLSPFGIFPKCLTLNAVPSGTTWNGASPLTREDERGMELSGARRIPLLEGRFASRRRTVRESTGGVLEWVVTADWRWKRCWIETRREWIVTSEEVDIKERWKRSSPAT